MNAFLRTLLLAFTFVSSPVMSQDKPSFAQVSEATRAVAEKYFAAYIARDWDSLSPLLAEDGGFSDPTAALVFGAVEYKGRHATVKSFRENYAAIKHMEFTPSRVFFSGEHAIFEGTLDWALSVAGGKVADTKAMPFLTILRVVKGRVVEHRDFADYAPYLDALRKARAGG